MFLCARRCGDTLRTLQPYGLFFILPGVHRLMLSSSFYKRYHDDTKGKHQCNAFHQPHTRSWASSSTACINYSPSWHWWCWCSSCHCSYWEWGIIGRGLVMAWLMTCTLEDVMVSRSIEINSLYIKLNYPTKSSIQRLRKFKEQFLRKKKKKTAANAWGMLWGSSVGCLHHRFPTRIPGKMSNKAPLDSVTN